MAGHRALALIGALVGPLGPAAPAAAQKPGVELGLQIASVLSSNSNSTTTSAIGVGGGAISVGFYVSKQVAIEPSLSLLELSRESETITATTIGLALPINFSGDWGRSGGVFIAPQVGTTRVTETGFAASQRFVGVAVGLKLRGTENLVWRFQASLDRYLENDTYFGATQVGASFGIGAYF